MATFVLEDPTGRIDAIVFPRTFQQYGHVFDEDKLVVMGGKLDHRRGDLQFSCEEAKSVSLESMIENAKEAGFFDPNERVTRQAKKLELEVRNQKSEEENVADQIEDIDLDDDEDEECVEPYVIEVDDESKLSKIKKLLTENKGDGRVVEVHLKSDEGIKRIKVPFEVNVTEGVEKKIASCN